MSTVDDLTAFLRARLDEREAKANGALSGPWVVEEHTYETVVTVDGGQVVATVDGLRDGWHIADNDPEFVLADVAAKRKILTFFDEDPPCLDGGYVYKDRVRELLALPYAGHPDYDEAWRP
jgi:hypothetical protein